MAAPAEERALRLRLRASELHARARRLAVEAARARDAAAREHVGVQAWRRGFEADEQERRRAVRRWADLIAGDASGEGGRGLAFFDADFCLAGDRQDLAAALLQAALRFGRAELGNVQLWDAEAGGLRIVAQRGFGPDFLSHFARVDDERSACGLAISQGRTVQVRDVAGSPVFDGGAERDVLLGAGVRAVRSIPLMGPGGAGLGVLSVHYGRPREAAPAERKLLATLADSAVRRLLRPPLPR